MPKNITIKVKPWCPFCGQDVDKPKEPLYRKMTEFTLGNCQCGAVYTCDPTGFNVGAAMVECLVQACHDDWDLAWELIPDDDYLSDRLDNYDEQTHQVVETQNLDGRKIKGVLYFIRLSKDISEFSQRLSTDKVQKKINLVPLSAIDIPEMEPARDPKRQKKRANKTIIKQMVEAQDIDGLTDYAFDDLKTLRFMQRLLYNHDEEKRWRCVYVMGQVCRRLSTRKPGAVSDLLHRMYEACSDSAATHWGLLEAISSIIAARSDIYGSFTRHILLFRSLEASIVEVLWGLGTIAEKRPDLVRSTPFYNLFSLIDHKESIIRGHAVRLFGRIKAVEVKNNLQKLLDDPALLTVYEKGHPVHTTVGKLAQEAITIMRDKEND